MHFATCVSSAMFISYIDQYRFFSQTQDPLSSKKIICIMFKDIGCVICEKRENISSYSYLGGTSVSETSSVKLFDSINGFSVLQSDIIIRTLM